MNNPTKAILKILRNNIFCNDKVVPVIRRTYPLDKSPCITIDDSIGADTLNIRVLQKKLPLDENHPQYDSQDPYKEFPQQTYEYKRNIELRINSWTNSEDERELINEQIMELIYKVQSDHYMFCSNYSDGNCAYLGEKCASTVEKTNSRGIKNQCPNPTKYGYKNIFKTFNLDRWSFSVEPPFFSDQTEATPPILHSIFRFYCTYYEYHVIGGKTSQTVSFKEDWLDE